MRLDLSAPQLRTLLERPSPATLTVYAENGDAITTPLWSQVREDAIQFVVAAEDKKLEHLRRDPRCVVLVFEAIPPFRGVRLRGKATITPDEGAKARLEIASRYLGPEAGRAYADPNRRPAGFLVRLPMSGGLAWDFSDSLP